MVVKPGFSVEELDIPKITPKNWLLAVIYEKDEVRPRDAVTLMNEVFVFVKELVPSIESEFDFKSTGFGPHSEKLAGSVKRLLTTNHLEIKEGGYVLTESGAKKAEKLQFKLPKDLRDEMTFLKLAMNHMGPTGMLQYIHSIYPQYVFLHEGGESIV